MAPSVAFQRPDAVNVSGYTTDAEDLKPAKTFRTNFFELDIRTPLIEADLTQKAVLALVQQAGMRLPKMYGQGCQNSHCIPGVQATSSSH